MTKTIAVKFDLYKESTMIKSVVIKSISASGIYNEIVSLLNPNLEIPQDLLEYLSKFDFNVDMPYRYVIRQQVYEKPTESVNLIKFVVNRQDPYIESYNLKVDNPELQLEQVESSFSVTGLYLDDSVLRKIFSNIPNDMPDYDPDPEESGGINGPEGGI